jgi:hypothetical protein
VGGRYTITLTADEINGSTPEIPPVTYKPVTQINGMPTVVRSDGKLEIYLGKQAATPNPETFVGYGPIAVDPIDAGAFTVLPEAQRKVQYALVDKDGSVYRLGDAANAGDYVKVPSLNSAEFGDSMQWTLKLDAKSDAAVSYSQKVTLFPPPFASGKSDYSGKYPETTVRVYVAGGMDASTEYYADFRIKAHAVTVIPPTPPKLARLKLYQIYQWIKIPLLGEAPGTYVPGYCSEPPNLKFIRGEKNGMLMDFDPPNITFGGNSMSGYKKIEILAESSADAYLCSYSGNENFEDTYFRLGDTSTCVCVFPRTTGNIKLKISIPAEYNNGTEAFEILTIPVVQK